MVFCRPPNRLRGGHCAGCAAQSMPACLSLDQLVRKDTCSQLYSRRSNLMRPRPAYIGPKMTYFGAIFWCRSIRQGCPALEAVAHDLCCSSSFEAG
eukprot:363474-Chlamydomonas_euryale.AAC.18